MQRLPTPAEDVAQLSADLLDDVEDHKTPGPQTVGDYHVVARLGGGGMSDVFLANKVNTFGFVRRAVIKRVKRSRPGFKNMQRMLLDEARATACFDHPNLVSILDVGEDEQGVYIALEYIEGTDLRWVNAKLRTRKEALPFELACYISGEVLRGLHHAHNARGPDGQPLDIVHRDVNPANVLISQTGHVKLADFGVVRMRDRVQQATEAGLVKGKYGYLAPEYIAGETCNHISDVYATGIMLFELLSGRECFSGTTTYEVMWKIVNRGVPLYRLEREGVPDDLSRIVQKATNPVPERRYSSAQDMANALETWLMRNGKHATPWVLSVFFQRHSLFPERPGEPLPQVLALPPGAEEQRALMSEHTPAPHLQPGMPISAEEDWNAFERSAGIKPPQIADFEPGESSPDPLFASTVRLQSELPTESATPLPVLSQPVLTASPVPHAPFDRTDRIPIRGEITLEPAARPTRSNSSHDVRNTQDPPPRMVPPSMQSQRLDASAIPTLPAISISQDDFPERPTPVPPERSSSTPRSPPSAEAASLRASLASRTTPSRVDLRFEEPEEAATKVPPPPPSSRNTPPPSISSSSSRNTPPPSVSSSSVMESPTLDPVDVPRGLAVWTGKLEEISAAEALDQLTKAGASGNLEFRCGLIWKRVHLDSGAPIAITSNMGMELIGEHLVKARLISRRELDRALHAAERDGTALTSKLLELNLIERSPLEEELGKNLAARLSEVLEWRWGTFEFTPLPPEPAALRPKLDLVSVIQSALEARARSIEEEQDESFSEAANSDQSKLKEAFKRARSISQGSGKGRVDQLGKGPPRQPNTKR
jgi:serine/threonine-protein kinase